MTLRDGDAPEHPFDYPVFVKPARLGSSVGISKVRARPSFDAAVALARGTTTRCLIEEGLDGVEVECGVLGNRDPIASVVGEIVAHAEWYDYSAKYDEGGMELVIPARISPEADDRVRSVAVESFVATECEGMARIDFFVRPSGEVVVNEINTIPGFTSTSVYAKLFEASGVSYARPSGPAHRARTRAPRAPVAAPVLDAREQALGLRAMPLEAERFEALVRPCEQLVVAARHAQRPERERLDGRSWLRELRRLASIWSCARAQRTRRAGPRRCPAPRRAHARPGAR